jgi:hypothetical protein
MRRMVSAEDDTPILGAPIRVLVHLDSPILWIDMYIPSADAMASAEARALSLNSQDCGSEGITPYIYSVLSADRGKDRELIRGDIDGMLT